MQGEAEQFAKMLEQCDPAPEEDVEEARDAQAASVPPTPSSELSLPRRTSSSTTNLLPGGGGVNRSGAFGSRASLPGPELPPPLPTQPPSAKSYKTPAVPRHTKKFQSNNSSTPRNIDETKGARHQAMTVKEQIENNFGFDDSTDDDSDTTGVQDIISPVQKVPGGRKPMKTRGRYSPKTLREAGHLWKHLVLVL